MPKPPQPRKERERLEMAEDEEREQSRILRKGEKPLSSSPNNTTTTVEEENSGTNPRQRVAQVQDADETIERTSREEEQAAEIDRLRDEIAKLKYDLKNANQAKDNIVRQSFRRQSLQRGGLYGLSSVPRSGSTSFTSAVSQVRNAMHELDPTAEDEVGTGVKKVKPGEERDLEVEKLEREGLLTNKALERLEIKGRMQDDVGRAGFRMLMESKEENKVDILTIPEGIFNIPSLTKMQAKVKWVKEPRKVLLVKRPNDPEATAAMTDILLYLGKRKITSYLEDAVQKETMEELQKRRYNFNSPYDPVFATRKEIGEAAIDFIACLGGDGTILWACGMFSGGIPPIVSFKMGSLGFLTPFPVKNFADTLKRVLRTDMEITVRSRLQITIKKKGMPPRIETCLNEMVCKHHDKMISLDVYSGQHKLTVVHADGLIVATPTGSTAYSLACGGSMLHPAIPAMVLTPIAPHTLSFRPMVLADSSTLRIVVPKTIRTEVYLSLDGREVATLEKDDMVEVTVSEFPVAAYCEDGESTDWFNTIKASFLWNVRTDQKEL